MSAGGKVLMANSREHAHFEEIEHTADVGIKSHADSLPELFANIAAGMYHLIFGPLSPKSEKSQSLHLSASSYEDLLVDWLSELNYLLLVHHFVVSTFSKISITDKSSVFFLDTTLWGEDVRKYYKQMKTEIKAVTYHQLHLQQDATGFKAQVIFDI
jgi:SHS2 domain-containing protein